MHKIHGIVKSLRLEHGYTLKEVAERLGVTEATAQRYESGNGIKDIPYEKIIAYSELFRVSPTYLITGENDVKPVYSEKNAMLANAMRKDNELSDAVYKLIQLTAEDKAQIYGLINLLYSKQAD